jgi:hypothetical protein
VIRKIVAVALCACAWGADASAQDAAGDAVEAVRSCSTLLVDSHRLACYDAVAARLHGAQGADSRKDPEASLADSRKGSAAPIADRRKSAESPTARQMTAHIASVTYLQNGNAVIRLDSGQTWVQTETTLDFPLKAGDEVTISKGAMTSFWLRTPAVSYPMRVRERG